MTRVLRSVLFLVVATLMALPGFGAADAKGSKDHPLFTRMPGYYISSYEEKEFDAFKFRVKEDGQQKEQTVEGHVWSIAYLPDPDRGTKPASKLQIIRNFTSAIRAIGGQVLFELGPEAGSHAGLTLRFVKGGRETWVMVDPYQSGRYDLVIVEKEAMQQDIVANAASFANDLRATGKTAIYGIYFDTAKSELKPESAPAIAEIATLLNQNPSLKVFIVGHTDMVGDPVTNTKLSYARAQSVISALVSQHRIASNRLIPFGAGPYAPVASNRDEDGRAKNRRVELVEIATK